MKITKLAFYCCLLIPGSFLLADCNTAVSREKVPAFIDDDQIEDYLTEERKRQKIACSVTKGGNRGKAIYVQDNRFDVYLAKGAVREAARSTAALISAAHLEKQGNDYVINKNLTLQDAGWCASEPFASQPIMANCTAFLVDKNILVTAGHCLRPGAGQIVSLQDLYVVFGFQMNSKNQAQTRFPASDVYRMKKELEVKKNQSEDWAVVELDRPVVGRSIFDFEADEIVEGTGLTIFGYPNGLPLKIADGGMVKRNDYNKNIFATDLDSYQGNSGSPVLNAEALKQGRFVVEGILVSGSVDARNLEDCKVSVTCQSARINNPNGYCSGEMVTKINRVVAMGSEATSPLRQQNPISDDNIRIEGLPDDLNILLK
ncbi:MAG: serine protease [Methylococcales bacterium]